MSALISQACDGSEGSYLLDSIDPKLLIYGGCTNSCCLMFDWVIDKFYHKEKEELGSGIYELIDEEVAKVPAGCEGSARRTLAVRRAVPDHRPICPCHVF